MPSAAWDCYAGNRGQGYQDEGWEWLCGTCTTKDGVSRYFRQRTASIGKCFSGSGNLVLSLRLMTSTNQSRFWSHGRFQWMMVLGPGTQSRLKTEELEIRARRDVDIINDKLRVFNS